MSDKLIGQQLIVSETIKEEKKKLRRYYRSVLTLVPSNKRMDASLALYQYVCQQYPTKMIMSFASMPEEISTDHLNAKLAKEKRLVLPRVSYRYIGMTGMTENYLEAYVVDDLSQLKAVPPFGILEPDPHKHVRISPNWIHAILVPGLAFDSERYRLGRGKGYYDKFLATCPANVIKIGVGFQDQKAKDGLPRASYDIRMDDVKLF